MSQQGLGTAPLLRSAATAAAVKFVLPVEWKWQSPLSHFSRLDVLVEAEEIGRIVFPLHLGQPFIVVAERPPDNVFVCLALEVQKVVSARMRLERAVRGL